MEDKLILLVEDNPHIMAINDAALHMRGYRTLQAETAHKCRELLCFHAVDLIVLIFFCRTATVWRCAARSSRNTMCRSCS